MVSLEDEKMENGDHEGDEMKSDETKGDETEGDETEGDETKGDETKGNAKDPSGFLSDIVGAIVKIKLNSGVIYTGNLQSVDGYMNIAIERCQEISNGEVIRNWGDSFIRGNNVAYICATKEK